MSWPTGISTYQVSAWSTFPVASMPVLTEFFSATLAQAEIISAGLAESLQI
jgi:hypothetical protein